MKSVIRKIKLLSMLLCLSIVLGMSSTASSQTVYNAEIVVKIGDEVDNYGPIVDLGEGPSINDTGKVSFIGRKSGETFNGRVFVDNAGAIERNFEITNLQIIQEDTQINNSDQVTWQDQVTTNGDTFIRRLDSATGGEAMGIGSTFFTNTVFSRVIQWPSLNNNGRAVFGADLQSGGRVLAARNNGSDPYDNSGALSGGPAFHPMISDNNRVVVKGGAAVDASSILNHRVAVSRKFAKVIKI